MRSRREPGPSEGAALSTHSAVPAREQSRLRCGSAGPGPATALRFTESVRLGQGTAVLKRLLHGWHQGPQVMEVPAQQV